MSVRLHITQRQRGWRVQLVHPDVAYAEGLLTTEQVAALIRGMKSLLGPEPVLNTTVLDADRTQREERAGRVISKVISTPEVASILHTFIGHALAWKKTAVLLVDARDAEVRALPWELIASPSNHTSMESTYGLVVARLSQGGPMSLDHTTATQLRVLLWCPESRDPVVASVRARLEALPKRALIRELWLVSASS